MSAVVADIRPLRESAHFRRLWVGITVGQLGQQMTNVAVAYQVWSLSRSSVRGRPARRGGGRTE
ncbi:MAG: hypothetical protein ACRDVO_15890 [Jiangellaceae bacterium]